MSNEMTGAEWCEEYGVTFDWRADGFHRDPDGWEHQRFTFTLTDRQGVELELPYKAGVAVDHGDGPDADLLHMHGSDAASGALTWEEFAGDYGYDPMEAPVREYRTWEACRDMRERVREFCDSSEMFEAFCAIRDAGDES